MKLYYMLVILIKLAVAAMGRNRRNSAYLQHLMKQILVGDA